MRQGITSLLAKLLRWRSAIDAEIRHMNSDGQLTGRMLRGMANDAIFAALCARGKNIRKILAHLRTILALIMATLLAYGHCPANQFNPQAA